MERRDSPLRAELESPVMKEGSQPDHNTKPRFLLAKAQTNVGDRQAASWIRKMNSDWILSFFYLKFLSIPMQWIKCEPRTEKACDYLCGRKRAHRSQQRRTMAQGLCPREVPFDRLRIKCS